MISIRQTPWEGQWPVSHESTTRGIWRTVVELGLVLGRIVGLDSPEEVFSAAAGSHVLDPHIDPLLKYPVADLHEMLYFSAIQGDCPSNLLLETTCDFALVHFRKPAFMALEFWQLASFAKLA